MESCELNKFAWIDGFGEELNELVYEGMSSWLVSFRSVTAAFGGHFSYLIVHLSVIACGVLTFQHAWANGSRFIQFWWGAMIHGILSENGITGTRYWHAQAPIMLFGKRLPLHMVLFYPSLLYLGVMGVQKFRLNICSEPAAIGMLVMLMEIPYRILSVKFLHITYHDTDPIYSSKFCGVPWIEIFSSMVSAASYVVSYYAVKCQFLTEEHIRWERAECEKKETMLTAASSFISPIPGFLQKILFFYVLHDNFNINPSTCLFFLFSLYFSFVCYLDGRGRDKARAEEAEDGEEEKDTEYDGKVFLYCALGVYIACLLYIAIICKPENEISIGGHEPTGDCTTLICSRSPLGKILKRKKYLCVDDVLDRHNFVYSFKCLPDGPPYLNAIWYTICGTAMRNRAQFLTNIISFVIIISAVFLKSWLTVAEKEVIWRRLSTLRGLRKFLPGRRVREPVVTFEEPQGDAQNGNGD